MATLLYAWVYCWILMSCTAGSEDDSDDEPLASKKDEPPSVSVCF